MLYYANGSNMLTYRLGDAFGKVEVVGVARLTGHVLKNNKVSSEGSLKAKCEFHR